MTHPLVTEEMVEKALREFARAPVSKVSTPPAIRAALSAVIDDVIERCAQEAEQFYEKGDAHTNIHECIALLIRSLKANAR